MRSRIQSPMFLMTRWPLVRVPARVLSLSSPICQYKKSLLVFLEAGTGVLFNFFSMLLSFCFAFVQVIFGYLGVLDTLSDRH